MSGTLALLIFISKFAFLTVLSEPCNLLADDFLALDYVGSPPGAEIRLVDSNTR
jgi:hypothetical protein